MILPWIEDQTSYTSRLRLTAVIEGAPRFHEIGDFSSLFLLPAAWSDAPDFVSAVTLSVVVKATI
jgi:hypothetical protein